MRILSMPPHIVGTLENAGKWKLNDQMKIPTHNNAKREL